MLITTAVYFSIYLSNIYLSMYVCVPQAEPHRLSSYCWPYLLTIYLSFYIASYLSIYVCVPQAEPHRWSSSCWPHRTSCQHPQPSSGHPAHQQIWQYFHLRYILYLEKLVNHPTLLLYITMYFIICCFCFLKLQFCLGKGW